MKVTNKQEILSLLKENNNRLMQLGVRKVGVFGSFITNEQQEDSDVDLLVEFSKDKKNFNNFMGVAELTETILGRKVDLLTPESLSPYIAPHIQNNIEYVQIA
ncbi:nucleotidyltransferase [Candidatus Woesebacteria bacterium RIFCSPHIGHO2_01_FULL_44_10]|uniref:Nucleotidyltransferase n=1 Tax=Candidatus Woesebacteria bacterium RIFCSPLOWO2_01_FULL_44_14 TaxID=1802525 RepID=A0A1F8BXM0_9BACT|nr:MAG: nucleotidyltransferase [Candidatus Woesebacteria bacterium RIFCSPHIGHO2_01_FULL_44_10]OGM56451.1 MAG: nucleotidyltransferase [Candidatus Woesebacteria bacterium RIFCSPHIGHO2_12_FULL_44_11]OGM68853.1 MAG: nucleotidyltransferase [Candidatus Woesebacteria bacterium RIFCSPLOWO2_01_FULL_44_14]